jgi:cell division inhibitor SepF
MMVKLGFEDEYDDYYDEDDFEGDAPVHDDYDDDPVRRRPSAAEGPYVSGAGVGAVRRVDRTADLERARESAGLRSVPAGRDMASSVPQVKMHIVEPKSFDEARVIADKFKQGTPVIMNLVMTNPDVAKRLIDFASGLTYGLDGGLQKVSDKVFMLSPANVEVSDTDRRRLQSTGLFPRPE